MNLTLRSFLGLSALVASLALPAGAQPGRPHPHGPTPGLHREEQAYVQANVLPVLRRQRQQLEQELAPADRTQLAACRAQLKALRQREQALHQAARAEPRPTAPDSARRPWGRPQPTPEQQAVRAEQRATMRQVAELAQKYQANLDRLAAARQPQRAQWAADLRALAAKSRPAAAPAEHPGHFHGLHLGELHRMMRGISFLLLEPAPAEPAAGELLGTSLYPNPVAAVSQLQYDVKTAGPVTVALLDKNGTPLRTLVQAASQEKGTFSQELNLGDLPSGTYFYQVTTRAGTETKRFVKE